MKKVKSVAEMELLLKQGCSVEKNTKSNIHYVYNLQGDIIASVSFTIIILIPQLKHLY